MGQMENEQPQPQPEQPQAEWTPPTRDEFEQVVQAFWQAQARNEAMASYINAMGDQQQAPAAQPEAQPEDEDDLLYDPDRLREVISQETQNAVQQQLNQHPMVRQAAEQRGAQIAQGVFNEIEAKIGAFDRAMAYHVAQSFAYANPNVDPVQALYAGAQQARDYGEQVRQQAVEEYRTQLNNLSQPGEPGAGPPGQPSRPPSTDYDEVADRFFARRNNPQLSPN